MSSTHRLRLRKGPATILRSRRTHTDSALRARAPNIREKTVHLVGATTGVHPKPQDCPCPCCGKVGTRATMQLPWFYIGPNRASVRFALNVASNAIVSDQNKNRLLRDAGHAGDGDASPMVPSPRVLPICRHYARVATFERQI